MFVPASLGGSFSHSLCAPDCGQVGWGSWSAVMQSVGPRRPQQWCLSSHLSTGKGLANIQYLYIRAIFVPHEYGVFGDEYEFASHMHIRPNACNDNMLLYVYFFETSPTITHPSTTFSVQLFSALKSTWSSCLRESRPQQDE